MTDRQISENKVKILEYLLYDEKLTLNNDDIGFLAEDIDLSVDCINMVVKYMNENKRNKSLINFIKDVNQHHWKNERLTEALAKLNNQNT
jgi:hypothetical protein